MAATVMFQYEKAALPRAAGGAALSHSSSHALAKRQDRDDADGAHGRLAADAAPSSKKAKVDEDQSVRRSGRMRNQAMRAGFIDSSYLHYDEMFSQQHPMLMSRDGTTTTTNNNDEEEEEGDDDEEEDDVEVSPLYQAAIPTLRARPAQPSAREARFLQAVQVFAPPQHANGGGGVSRGGGAAASTATMQDGPPAAAGADAPNSLAATTQAFKVAYLGAAPRHRTALLACAVADLDQQLGVSLTQVLNLDLLGAKFASTWQPHEELLFCLGMCDRYRMFKRMRRLYLKSRSVHELNGYYHNVWKTRSTPEADDFLTLRERAAQDRDFWAYEQTIRQRLAAMWKPAEFGDMPVSAAGPAPLRPRTARQGLAKSAAMTSPPAARTKARRSAAGAAKAAARSARAPASSSPSPSMQRPIVNMTGLGAGTVSVLPSSAAAAAAAAASPAAAASAQSTAGATGAPPATTTALRPGTIFLSSAGGRVQLGAAGQAAQQQPAVLQQQQQPRLGAPMAQLTRPNQQCTVLLVPMQQRQQVGQRASAQQPQQHSQQQQVVFRAPNGMLAPWLQQEQAPVVAQKGATGTTGKVKQEPPTSSVAAEGAAAPWRTLVAMRAPGAPTTPAAVVVATAGKPATGAKARRAVANATPAAASRALGGMAATSAAAPSTQAVAAEAAARRVESSQTTALQAAVQDAAAPAAAPTPAAVPAAPAPALTHAAAAAAAAGAPLDAAGLLSAGLAGNVYPPITLAFPEMPKMPELPLPDGSDREALQEWLKELGACRAAMADYKQQVHNQTDIVLQDAHKRIALAQAHRQRALVRAESYLQDLGNREARVLNSVGPDKRQQLQRLLSAADPAHQAQLARRREQRRLRKLEQQQQQEVLPTEQPSQQQGVVPPLPPQHQQQQQPPGNSQAHAQLSQARPLDGLAAAVQHLLQRPNAKPSSSGGSSRPARCTVTWCNPPPASQQHQQLACPALPSSAAALSTAVPAAVCGVVPAGAAAAADLAAPLAGAGAAVTSTSALLSAVKLPVGTSAVTGALQ